MASASCKPPTNGPPSQPRADGGLADVLLRVLAHAVEDLGAGPEHGPAQVVRVALDLRVEEVDRAALGAQQLLGVVEVLPGLGDRALGAVVERLVLVARDDVAGLQ